MHDWKLSDPHNDHDNDRDNNYMYNGWQAPSLTIVCSLME